MHLLPSGYVSERNGTLDLLINIATISLSSQVEGAKRPKWLGAEQLLGSRIRCRYRSYNRVEFGGVQPQVQAIGNRTVEGALDS